MTIINSSLNLTKKEILEGAFRRRQLANHISSETRHKFLNDIGGYEPISEAFQQKRNQLLAKFSQLGARSVALKQIKSATTLRELFASMIDFPNVFLKKAFPKPSENLRKKLYTVLQEEQEVYKCRHLYSTCFREINLAFCKQSKNPEVVKIENILKEKYGIKKALLEDDLGVAKKILEAVEFAKTKGVKLPDEIIVTNFTLGRGECLRMFKDNQEFNTVLFPHDNIVNFALSVRTKALNQMPKNIKQIMNRWAEVYGFKAGFSTKSPIHLIIHEMMHQTHPEFLAFWKKKIPAKYLPVVRRLSAYSAMNEKNNYEIYTELATKTVLGKLEPDEKELIKILGGDV